MATKKYLSEGKLQGHLKKIYPENLFIHNNAVPGSQNKRSRPDYYCKELQIIVEFDGPLHYTSAQTIVRDRKKDKIFEEEGIKTIRIPYFVQMTPEIINLLFGIDVKFKQYFPHGFVDESVIMPCDFCELGIQRFREDLIKFGIIYDDIRESLQEKLRKKKEIDLILPSSLCQQFNLSLN
jgi:hypothetical protein